METGYQDLDDLYNQQNQALDKQKEMQKSIIDKQTDVEVNRMNTQKDDYDREAEKVAKGLYTSYQKASSNYGVEAEIRAERGLNNSGYAESSQVNLYNDYQRNLTEVITKTNELKAKVDQSINEAYANADIQKAQAELELYKQQSQLALQQYEYKHQRDREKVADEQWQKGYDLDREQFDWNKSSWQQQFDYQKQRDTISDSQWEKQYQLSLQNSRQ